MNRRVVLLGSLGVSLALFAVTRAEGQDATKSPHFGNARGYYHMIEALRASDDLQGLRRLAKELQGACRATNDPLYYHVFLDVCIGMHSTRSTEAGVTEEVRDLALAALDVPGEKPPRVTHGLLLFLHGDLDYSTSKLAGEEWVAVRRARAERWLRAWRSIRDQNAALPYPSEVPLNWVPHPGAVVEGSNGPPIKDPVQRKEYEDAVERNRRLIEAQDKKSGLDRFEEYVETDAARYLTEAYSRPPFRTDELRTLLIGFSSAKERKAIFSELFYRGLAEQERAAAVTKAVAGVAPAPAGKCIQYSFDGTTFRDVPLPFYVEKDTPITFRAPFAGETCAWNGSAGVTGKGPVMNSKCVNRSEHVGDFKTVTAVGNGTAATAHVVVFELQPVLVPGHDFPDRDYDTFGPAETLYLSYKTVPLGIRDVDLGGLRWVIEKGGGDMYGSGGGVATYDCALVGTGFTLKLQTVGRGAAGPRLTKANGLLPQQLP